MRAIVRGFVGACVALASVACSDASGEGESIDGGPSDAGEPVMLAPPGPIAAEPQQDGDPVAGYTTLVDWGYVTCGIPYSAYSRVAGPAPAALRLPGRTGRNVELPYMLTATTTASGVEIVAPNCLTCHASYFRGEVVIGLGNASSDYTSDMSGPVLLAKGLVPDDELHEWQRFYDKARVVGPRIMTRTIGPSSADNLAAVLFSYRDPETLAWLDRPALPLPPVVVPVDVPPWWRMAKKNAMFYSAAGRGDHVRFLIGSTSLCSDDVDEVRVIEQRFGDVYAYIRSIEPPAWPGTVDEALAAQGRTVFEATCSRCHGTYGETETYPNLVVGIDEIGTDSVLMSSAYFTGVYVDWFERSFYGETGRLEPAEGYVAPPLDGVWATAPFLHNGSVPTLAQLLDSTSRPRYWTRDFEAGTYDMEAVGWAHTALDYGQDTATASERRRIYDTTQLGYGNGGHTFGDALTADDRRAVIEYLKTL